MTNVDEQVFIHSYINKLHFYVVKSTGADNVFHSGKHFCTKCIKMKLAAILSFIPVNHCPFFDGVKSDFF
tara:strand:- start:266 stop:475 length:210 start_codon:yes stop_codon:yes gene_type:complete